MEWLEITLPAASEELDILASRLEDFGITGVITEDENEINVFLAENEKYWDSVDEAFIASMAGVSRLKFYLENSEDGISALNAIRAAMPGRSFGVKAVRDEDWENNWKEYYKPIEAGKLLIVPEWEDAPETDKTVLRLDPGLIFGTGAHATTRLCLEALSDMSLADKSILDLGCGSGILAIAGLLLGAKSAVCVDIDEKAPSVVTENAALNGIGKDRLSVFAGDVLSDRDFAGKIVDGKFEVVMANIVADVIIALAENVRSFMAPGGIFVTSGIIDGRENDVRAALDKCGFASITPLHRDNWNAFICRLGDK